MLEVKNLKKIYKTQKGAPVHALDGVSLRFPETGMVFLLGKSGSGKSTLLNVCGGLDNPTEGEVIVKGRSSKDFSQSDFDSYRNTFVGFIFQEYNILNEFSVEDNIALALELQGKSKDKKAIAELLEEVDLTGYAKRKPNTLSGGQKQRIAIARALIKKPEIIMADEPTGALDSNTGKQVLDTLKKLSKTKLVIVVSHDREFAEQYGDRIIELKDGLVLSDESKTNAVSESVSDNMNILGDVLCIRKGVDLTESDFERIKSFLKKSDKDVVIATDEKSVKTFKSAARITEAGEMEVFRQTDPEKTPLRVYTKEDSRFIRSKLPLRHAFKIGTSGLKSKPFRLSFTVLLCSVAFVLFGLLSTLNFYNSEATFRQTMRDTEISAVRLRSEYKAAITWYSYGEKQYSYEYYHETKFAPQELVAYQQSLNPLAFGVVSAGGGFNVQTASGDYWRNYLNGFGVLPEGHPFRDRINGAYPQKNDEILLTTYSAQMLVECKGYDANGAVMELGSVEELIGKKIGMNNQVYTITGILDTGMPPEQFDDLKENSNTDNYSLLDDYSSVLDSGLYLLAFVSQDRLEGLSNEYTIYKEDKTNYMRISAGGKRGGEYQLPEYGVALYNGVSQLPGGQKFYPISKDGTDISDKEIILPSNRFASYLGDVFNGLGEEANNKGQYTAGEKYYKLAEKAWSLSNGGVHEYNKEKDTYELKPYTATQYEACVKEILQAVKEMNVDLKIGVRIFDDRNSVFIGDLQEFTIVGLYEQKEDRYEVAYYMSDTMADRLWEQQKVVVSDYPEMETQHVFTGEELYNNIYLPGNVPEDKIDAYWELYNNQQDENAVSRVVMTGGVVNALLQVDYMVKELSQIFLYVGLVLAVFAALLLSNFISVSIANKKRDIGILRAVGARSIDVFKIFLSESFVIGTICVVISAAASYLLCGLINTEYASMLGASVFVFGPASMVVLVGIAMVTILVATFLPVYNAAKKKPVESIRAI